MDNKAASGRITVQIGMIALISVPLRTMKTEAAQSSTVIPMIGGRLAKFNISCFDNTFDQDKTGCFSIE